ncbi:MAG TPA: SDR family NAD(P)-dependent oxidoreductase [Candidatus Acidoferrum sp.]
MNWFHPDVFITGVRQAGLNTAVAEIGSNATGVQGDVSNRDDLDRLFKEVATKKGKLDVLFANAGFVEPKIRKSLSL